MFDIWVRDTEITTLIVLTAVLVVLPVQLIICFKAKKTIVKLIPTIFLSAAVLVFVLLMRTARDWIALWYVILAAFFGVLLLFSGFAWGIWGVVKLIRKKDGGPKQ